MRLIPPIDYSAEPTTLCEFMLEEVPEGTRLTVVESGFDGIPASRREEAFRMNEGGWAGQLGSSGPHSIAQLASESPYTRQAITKHLEVLSAAGLVRSDRRGRERLSNVEADRLDAARHYLDQVSLQWDTALGRLTQFVEK